MQTEIEGLSEVLQSKLWSWSGALPLFVFSACHSVAAVRPLQPSAASLAEVRAGCPQPSAANAPALPRSPVEPAERAHDAPVAATDADPVTRSDAQAAAARAREIARYRDEVSEQGQRAHGLYFNAPMARKLGVEGISRILRGGRLDAAVIDVKDDAGRVTFDTKIPELAQSRHVFFRDLPAFVRELRRAGVYTIARIVCFNDPIVPKLYPDRAVIDTRPGHTGAVWNLHKGRNTWLNPYDLRNHDLLIALATEAQSLGFDEIQLDYIRFPVDEGTKFATFPGEGEIPRRDALLGMLRRMDEALHIPIGVDVFGLTAFRHGDPNGLGQSLEDWAAHVEVFTPMLYVNGMKGWLERKAENRAGLLVEAGVRILRERVGPEPVIRPFLQAFEEGADYYTGAFVSEQIRGARDGGGDGFLFWHPGSNYGLVREGMAGVYGEVPFRIEERRAVRARDSRDPQAIAQGVDASGSELIHPADIPADSGGPASTRL